jgi:hypothetical protein
MTEDDDGNDNLLDDIGIGNNETGKHPGHQRQSEPEPNFEIIEADDNFNPIEDIAIADSRFAEEEGQGTYVEQQQREQRLSPKREQRQRQRAARDRTKEEIEFLRAQIAELQGVTQNVVPRLDQYDQSQKQAALNGLTAQLNEHKRVAELARQHMAQAITEGNGEQVAKALEIRDQAIIAANRAEVQRNLLAAEMQRQPAQQQQQAPAQLPRAIANKAKEFSSRHQWYDPNDQNNVESQIVLKLDDAVARDGFDPMTQEYWDELENRVEKYLPQMFEQTPRQPQRQSQQVQNVAPRRGPQIAGPADRGAPQAGTKQVILNPARKQAMVQAGVLSPDGNIVDRGRYNRLMNQYANFDRDNGAARR